MYVGWIRRVKFLISTSISACVSHDMISCNHLEAAPLMTETSVVIDQVICLKNLKRASKVCTIAKTLQYQHMLVKGPTSVNVLTTAKLNWS